MTNNQNSSRLRVSDSLNNGRLLYTNSPQTHTVFKIEPDAFDLQLILPPATLNLDPTSLIVLEAGPTGQLPWGRAEVSPAALTEGYQLRCKIPGDLKVAPGSVDFEVNLLEKASRQPLLMTAYPLTMVWVGHSGFDPAIHGYNFVNSGGVYGAVRLDRKIFNQTYGWGLDKEKFFRKMYRDILGATVDENGPIPGQAPLSSGLCTGMIRSSLAFYLQHARPTAHDLTPVGPTLDTIMLYHGRQLTDRALLQATGWIVRGGPRRVFEEFKKEVMRGNPDPMAFDIGVAAWGRKDFWRAIQAEGHTTIPYAFRQEQPDQGEIFIYNPNNPADQDDYGYANAPAGQARRLEKHVIRFDLTKNTYYYSDHYQSVRPNGDGTTIVAVHQSAYEQGRSALIASIANRFI